MGDRNGTANGITRGPRGLPMPAASFVTEAKRLATADYGGQLPANADSIIKRAAATGFNELSTAALLFAAHKGQTKAVESALTAFPKQIGGLNLTTTVSASRYDGEVHTKTIFRTATGASAGTMNRNFESDRVYHAYFQLDSNVKGAGAGYKIFKHQVDAYTKAGYKKLEVSAAGGNGFNGAYTWGRFGYRFKYASDSRDYTNAFGNYMRSNGVADKQRAKIMAKLDGTQRPGDIARVVAKVSGPNGQTRNVQIGKLYTQDRGWSGVFDLTKGSADRKYMNSYPKVSKAIRAQTGAP